MADNRPFGHLSLIRRLRGPAKLHGRPPIAALTLRNKADRRGFRIALRKSAANATVAWKLRIAGRDPRLQSVLPPKVPFLLEIDPSFDLEKLQQLFGFEVVSEQEDGFVLVATEDVDLNAVLRAIDEFSVEIHGMADVAKLHRLHEDPNLSLRLERLLSDDLLAKWPTIGNQETWVCDFGISCAGTVTIPPVPKRGKPESDEDWARRQAEWSAQRQEAYDAWDTLMSERLAEVERFVRTYGGEIADVTNDQHPAAELTDSFTVRIKVSGQGLRDFVLNYPYLFEVVEPDDIQTPQAMRETLSRARDALTIMPPAPSAPYVCVIDSGIQEEHFLLEPAIDKATSRCFLPGISEAEVGDFVPPGGHGTRVAGAILYGERVPREGTFRVGCWIQNARVLDGENRLPVPLFPPTLFRSIVERYHDGERRTRLFNHSIAAAAPARARYMSAWAAEIDHLSHAKDILVIQSVGNIFESGTPTRPGISDHLVAGRTYPEYLSEPACRIANPAQSLQAVTVGSVTYDAFRGNGLRSIAPGRSYPSPFTRSGPGIWDTIKPEVVEFGGDYLVSEAEPTAVATPAVGSSCYPELVRSTLFPPGPAYDRDAVGTSFSAPKVTRIAAKLQEVLPKEPCLLYRALIVQSARWPTWTRDATPEEQAQVLRRLGYGVPDIDRATSNTDYRTTLITEGLQSIKPRECHLFQVRIPERMRQQAEEYQVLIEITLSFSAAPRRTRRKLGRYLSTWADWVSSRLGESVESFRGRMIKADEGTGTGIGRPIRWTLAPNPRQGIVPGINRNASTVQKDWALVESNQLPKDFCIAVRGHVGWSKDPDATANYALAVSFEVVNKEIEIYQPLQVSVAELQAEIETEIEADAEVELPTS